MNTDHPHHEHPRIGTGVWIRKEGKILLGFRTWKHAPNSWCPPGGKVELYEDPFDCARRETREESGLEIDNIRFITYTNDLYPQVDQHYVTLQFVADWKEGEPHVMEPDKFAEWRWFGFNELPEPILLSARNFLETGYNPLTI